MTSSNNNILNDDMRLQLSKMIAANDVDDQTDLIRQLKHSHKLQDEINTLLRLKVDKKKEMWSDENIRTQCSIDCFFLFTHYTDIFNKLLKDEIDLRILNHFLNVLRQIEDGEMDQHEGSFLVGTLLKELYIDSALKKAAKIKEEEEKPGAPPRDKKDISWSQYKKAS